MKLYLRIWLAIVVTIVIFATVAGILVRKQGDHMREQMREQVREQIQGGSAELDVVDANGKVVGHAKPPIRRGPRELDTAIDGSARPDQPPPKRAYAITLDNGEKLEIVLPQRQPRPYRPNQPWFFSPWGLVFAVSLIALAVALGAYPIVRRLTRRLERLQSGVEQWGAGQLSARVAVEGNDEVGFLAQKFNHAASQVETLVNAHKSLLANASHELRSPLARIRMALALLEANPDKGSETFNQGNLEINRNIQELDTLIEEILLASRLDSQGVNLGESESFDLMGLAAEECARVSAELLVANHTQGSFDMTGHPKLIRRMLRNLLENAHRHNNPTKGAVSLSLEHAHSKYVITVRDHGDGVPASECERIFEPFYRAKNATEQDGGVGLGLALVKSIAQHHRGVVTCLPTDSGSGGQFVVHLAPKQFR